MSHATRVGRGQRREHLAQSGAAVDGRRAAQPDEQAPRRPGGGDQLPEPAARRAERIEPPGIERDRLRCLDHGGPVGQLEPARAPRPSERVRRRRPRASVRLAPAAGRARSPRPRRRPAAPRRLRRRAAGPSARAAAAAGAPRTPLRLAGHASARTLGLVQGCFLGLLLAELRVGRRPACGAGSRTRAPPSRGRRARRRCRRRPRSPAARSRTRRRPHRPRRTRRAGSRSRPARRRRCPARAG